MVHVIVAILAGIAGAVPSWAGIAGLLKAVAGTNEVISTIMLNWIAIWVGVWCSTSAARCRTTTRPSVDVPVSNDVVEGAKLPVFWGDPQLQGLHIGIFIALAALSSSGAAQPHDARLRGARGRLQPGRGRRSGINVRPQLHPRDGDLRRVRRARRRAGPARVAVPGRDQRHPDHAARVLRDRGRPARAQHRDRDAAGALLFAGLLTGTSVRNLDPTVFEPQLAANLTYMIQGLVVLLISTDVLVVYLMRLRRSAAPGHGAGGGRMAAKRIGWAGVALGFLALFVAVPPLTVRSPVVVVVIAVLGMALRLVRHRPGRAAPRLERRHRRPRSGWPAATPARAVQGVAEP